MVNVIGPAYAHSLPQRPPEAWQPLEQHLLGVASRAADAAERFGSADWAWNAAWLHDLGKAAAEFQNYLREQNGLELADPHYDHVGRGRINHSSAGAAWAAMHLDRGGGTLLAYLIAGHHAGLPDYCSDTAGLGALTSRLQREGNPQLQLPGIAAFSEKVQAQIRPLSRPPLLDGSAAAAAGLHLWLRMLFSCLVDADYLDTEEFMQQSATPERGGYPALQELKGPFDNHMRQLAAAPQSRVNTLRQEILAHARAAGQFPPGLFSLNVPTGGGKTLASLAFAFEHAARHGQARIIYVIPYTSIIEQTANTLRAIFGPENVIEHHSNLDPERETQRSRLAAENWDAPIIVTTNVQFFESLYAARPSRCRKLHRLARSIVLLDEAQLLPVEWLTPCVDAINRLVADYGATVLLSTATQPTPPGLLPAREIITDPARLHAELQRVEIRMPRDLNVPVAWEDLAQELAAHNQVLCVVNTRRDCFELFKALHALTSEGTFHLSALMCGAHRSVVLTEIRQRLSHGLPTRVISTQLVEAGVDLDFPMVYRALAGLDSIAQAAGRCNREGKLNGLGQVTVFIPPKPPPAGLLRKAAELTRELVQTGLDPQQPATCSRYFQQHYARANNCGGQWLHKHFVKDARLLQFQFRTAAEEFRLIEECQQAVFVLYGDGENWIQALRNQGPLRHIMRHLQRYTVNVMPRVAEALITDGKLAREAHGMIVQILPSLYTATIGLDIFSQPAPIRDLCI